MQDLRVLVVDAADAVATIFAHHGEVAGLGESLDRVPDIPQVRPRTHLLDAAPHRFETAFGQPLRLNRRLADEVHAAGVAVEAFLDDCDIDVDDVTVLQDALAGDAMNDLKERLKKKLISQDDDRRAHEEVQKLTDKHVAEIDQVLAEKEKELMQV